MPARDPTLRPYRFIAWAIYIGAIALVVVLMVVSITRTLRGTVRPRPGGGALPTRAALRVCVTDLDALYQEQNRHAWSLASDLEGKDPLAAWAGWSHHWEERVDDLSDRCRLDMISPQEEGAAARSELAEARDAVLALHRAYASYVNRFAEQNRDLTRAAADALGRARHAVKEPR